MKTKNKAERSRKKAERKKVKRLKRKGGGTSTAPKQENSQFLGKILMLQDRRKKVERDEKKFAKQQGNVKVVLTMGDEDEKAT